MARPQPDLTAILAKIGRGAVPGPVKLAPGEWLPAYRALREEGLSEHEARALIGRPPTPPPLPPPAAPTPPPPLATPAPPPLAVPSVPFAFVPRPVVAASPLTIPFASPIATAPPPPSPPPSQRSNRPQRALSALTRGLGLGWARKVTGNPVVAAAVGAGLIHSGTLRRGLAMAQGLGLATPGGRARLARGVRIAARSMGVGATMAGRLGAAAGFVGATAGLTTAAVAFGKAIHGMTEESLRAQERLVRASGAMGAVFAEREVREILRDQRQGEKLAGSARGLMNAEQNLKDEIEPFETAITGVVNKVLATLEQTAADLLHPFAEILRILGKWDKDGIDPDSALARVMRMAKEAEDGRKDARRREYTRPTQFPRP